MPLKSGGSKFGHFLKFLALRKSRGKNSSENGSMEGGENGVEGLQPRKSGPKRGTLGLAKGKTCRAFFAFFGRSVYFAAKTAVKTAPSSQALSVFVPVLLLLQNAKMATFRQNHPFLSFFAKIVIFVKTQNLLLL